MSNYEDYNNVSKDYDKYRISMGIDVIAGMTMLHSHKNVEEIRLLDAGCGTGNPAKSLTQYGFRRLTLMDASSGMLNEAKEKLADEINKGAVENVVEATLPEMPFSDNTFDAVMFSMVLHHLDRDADGCNFPAIVATLHETHRVLGANGILTIAVPTPFTLTEGFWYFKLLPELTKRFVKRFPSLEQWEEMFSASNFRCVNRLSLLGADSVGQLYFDCEGPLKIEWRNAISYFAMATEEEIKVMEEHVKQMKAEGTLEQFMKDENKLNTVGSITVFVCMAE